MFAQLVSTYHLHPIVDHFTIALLTFGIAAEILAAAAVLIFRNSARVSVWSDKLRSTSLMLMIGGAVASVLSYFSGDAEADRLWDTMSPAAQQILASSNGAAAYLSHAVLGQYLMYAFLILAAWRVMLELSSRLARTLDQVIQRQPRRASRRPNQSGKTDRRALVGQDIFDRRRVDLHDSHLVTRACADQLRHRRRYRLRAF